MGIVSFRHWPNRSALLAPIQVFATWLNIASRPLINHSDRISPHRAASHLDLSFSSGISAKSVDSDSLDVIRTSRRRDLSSSISSACTKVPVNRLKIVREFDSGSSPKLAGRMVISGRMSDVCDELERMN